MLRISLISRSAEEVVLKIDGRLGGEDVHLLEREGGCYLRETKCLVLELEGIRFIDQAGIDLLRRWSGERLELRNASPFVQTLLKSHGLD